MPKLNYHWSIIGQENSLFIIDKAIKNKTLAHAYLFCGPSGLGKTKSGFNFAQILQCLNEKYKPCQKCINCRNIIKNQNPDFYVINKPSLISIQDIRDLKNNLITKPYNSQYKIALIIDAQKMNKEAQNAFLKILEEPPADTIIILTAENKKQLLPTIISRCQIINFKIVPSELIKKELIKRGIEEQKVEEIVRLSMGRPELAFSFLDNPDLLNLREDFISKFINLKEEPIIEKFKYAEELSKEETIRNNFYLEVLISWFRDLILIKINKQQKIINIKYLKFLKQQCTNYNLYDLRGILNQLIEIKNYSKNYNNWRLLWENIWLIID